MKICVAGQNNIAIEFVEFLLKFNYRVIACLNKNDLGINTFHRSYALYCRIHQIEIKDLSELYNYSDLIFISLEFDQIIDTKKFKSKQLYNLHFSLLPEYKGMYTSTLPILDAKEYSGVTLHEIDDGIDTGDIIAQDKFSIEKLTCEELYNLYTQKGIALIKTNFDSILKNRFLKTPQPYIKSSYFSKKSVDFQNISINLNATAFQIDCQIRAFVFPHKQLPKIFGKPVYKCDILNVKSKENPGIIDIENDDFFVINTIDYKIKIYIYRVDDFLKYTQEGNLAKIQEFIINNHDIKMRNKKGWDALIVAAYHGQMHLVKYFVEEIAWNLNTHNNNGTTFFMYAMSYSIYTNKLDFLIYVLGLKGIKINKKDFFGKSALDYALEHNHVDAIKLIEKHS